MSVWLIALICIAFTAVLMFALGMTLQSWLYSVPADNMVLRALAGGVVAGGFIGLWCFIDSRAPGKYDTILNFSGYDIIELDSFEAVRKVGEQETKVKYTRRVFGSKIAYTTDTGGAWARANTDGPAIAILVKEGDNPEPVRYVTKLDKNGNFPPGEAVYKQERGRGYIEEAAMGKVYKPRSGTVILSLLLNLVHFVVWLLVFWLIVHFAFWHAFSLAFVMWLSMTLIALPILFDKTRKAAKPAPISAPAIPETAS